MFLLADADNQREEWCVMVDNAKVAKTDIETSNGIIHVIDTVVLPK